MDKIEAQNRAAHWRALGDKLASAAGTDWQDINEWCCQKATEAHNRADECYAISRQLPEGDNGS